MGVTHLSLPHPKKIFHLLKNCELFIKYLHPREGEEEMTPLPERGVPYSMLHLLKNSEFLNLTVVVPQVFGILFNNRKIFEHTRYSGCFYRRSLHFRSTPTSVWIYEIHQKVSNYRSRSAYQQRFIFYSRPELY